MDVGERLVVESRAAWHDWLAGHQASVPEIWLVSVRRSGRRPFLAYAVACDEAVCFGWRPGQSQRLDEDAFVTRFAPRPAGARWSAAELDRARRLAQEGRLLDGGIAVLPRPLGPAFRPGPGRVPGEVAPTSDDAT